MSAAARWPGRRPAVARRNARRPWCHGRGSGAGRDQKEMRVPYMLQAFRHQPGFQRIAFVIRGIDRQHRGRDLFQTRASGCSRSPRRPDRPHRQRRARMALPAPWQGWHRPWRCSAPRLIRQRAAIRRGREHQRIDMQGFGLGLVIAAIPGRIRLDRIDQHPAHHPVPPRDRSRRGGHRHQRIHIAGIGLTHNPGLHATHRVAHHQTEMLDPKTIMHELVFGIDNVGVVVMGEFHPQAVRGLGRVPATKNIGNDYVIFVCIERLARTEQRAGEIRGQQAFAGLERAMKDEHRLS